MRSAPLVLALGLAWTLGAASAPFQERSPGVHRLVFQIEVDCGRAREVGWNPAEAGDEPVVELVAQLVQQRFGAMERSASVEFEPGTTRFRVSLPSIDQRDRELFEGMLRSMGVCELFFIAEGDELEAERQKLEAWRSLHPGGALDEFNALDPEDQGPVRGLAWFRAVFRGPDAEVESTYPVRLPTAVADHLGAASFERVGATQDRYGYPALSFEVRDSRQEDFERLTGAHLNQRLAILIDGKIRSAPTLNSKLIGGGIIEGRFTSEEVVGMAEAFSKLQGPLRVSAAR